MKLNKLFYTCLAIGISFGMGSVILMNGVFGKAEIEESISVFLIMTGCTILGVIKTLKKVYPVWNITIPTVYQDNKPKECYSCNSTACKECEILHKWKVI